MQSNNLKKLDKNYPVGLGNFSIKILSKLRELLSQQRFPNNSTIRRFNTEKWLPNL